MSNKHRSVIAALLSALVVTATSGSYADSDTDNSNLIKITNIVSHTRSSEDTVFTDRLDGSYRVSFVVPKSKQDIYSTEFFITDSDNKKHVGTVADSGDNCNVLRAGLYLRCNVIGQFQGKDAAIYRNFTINVLDTNKQPAEVIEDKMPELEVTMGSDNTLVLKNISSEKLKITKVEAGKYVSTDSSGVENGELCPSVSHSIKLIPRACSNGSTFTDTIKIEYDVDGKSLESKIVIACTCDKTIENALKTTTQANVEKEAALIAKTAAENQAKVDVTTAQDALKVAEKKAADALAAQTAAENKAKVDVTTAQDALKVAEKKAADALAAQTAAENKAKEAVAAAQAAQKAAEEKAAIAQAAQKVAEEKVAAVEKQAKKDAMKRASE